MMAVIRSLLDQAGEIRALPDVYARLVKKLEDPDASDRDLAAIVSLDPVISSRLLRIANGAFYGLQSRVTSIAQAISIIGRTALSHLVLGMAVVGSLDRLTVPRVEFRRHWQHSLLCGLITRRLARTSGYRGDADALFVAGLLHDIGRLLIWHGKPDVAAALWGKVNPGTRRSEILMAESASLGADHAQVGEALLREWALPPLLVTAARWHHDPGRADAHGTEMNLLHLADLMSHTAANVGDVDALLGEVPLFATLGLTGPAVHRVMEDAAAEFAELLDLFLWA